MLLERGRFLGRLSEFLESVEPKVDDDGLAGQIVELKAMIESVRSRINSDDMESRLETILSFIGKKMTEYSDMLDLEHSGSSLRLDLKKTYSRGEYRRRPNSVESYGKRRKLDWLSRTQPSRATLVAKEKGSASTGISNL
ncbi:hypothetical protein [Bradyrhizobium sp. CSS354]|uniref:hypothetical protein n=1 Tax=Bradyrhizobium sp. CSS354 TaxID=2699172 RepID=UPI0023B0BBCD|nr:hypothetical protein [Bradyrhizobium sp. CSS354]